MVKKRFNVAILTLLPLYVFSYSDPDFLIIGAMRSGTTSLYRYIMQHPNVLPALNICSINGENEHGGMMTHFFVTDFDKGIEWYRKQFPSKRTGKITGEKAPLYLFCPGVAERVRKFYPNIKLLVILRNPIDRIFSNYRRYPIDAESFKDYLDKRNIEWLTAVLKRKDIKHINRESRQKEKSVWLEFGRYANQLERWFRFFDRDQFLILIFEEFVVDPEFHMNRVFDFLGLPKYRLKKYKKFHFSYPKGSIKKREKIFLEKYYKSDKKKLENLLGRKLLWN